MSQFDWRSTRQLVVTVNRDQWESGHEAWEYFRKQRIIARVIRELKRTYGVKVKHYVQALEFHKDGFPHWHVFVDVTVKGKAGQIGQDILHHLFEKMGVGKSRIREEFIRDQHHWNQMVGYAAKHGYMQQDKSHQVTLPDWAKALRPGSVRRYTPSRSLHKKQKQVKAPTGDAAGEIPLKVLLACSKETLEASGLAEELRWRMESQDRDIPGRRFKTYEEKLNDCGSRTLLVLDLQELSPGMLEHVSNRGQFVALDREAITVILDIPYNVVKRVHRQAVYHEGIGLVQGMTFKEVEKLLIFGHPNLVRRETGGSRSDVSGFSPLQESTQR